MKKILLLLVVMSSVGHAQTQYKYVPKANKNSFSLMLGYGPTGVYFYQDRNCNTVIKKDYSPVYGAQYTRMFNRTFGGNLGFFSNDTAFAGITIGW